MSELPLSMVPCPGLAEVPVLGDSYHRPTAADSFVISIIMGYNSLSTLTHAKKITLPLRPSKSNRNKKNRRLLNCSIGTQRWGRHSSGVRRFCLGPGAVRRSQPTLIQAAHYLQQNVLSGGFSRGVIAAEDVISSTDFCSVILRTLDIFLRHFAWVNNRLISIFIRGERNLSTPTEIPVVRDNPGGKRRRDFDGRSGPEPGKSAPKAELLLISCHRISRMTTVIR